MKNLTNLLLGSFLLILSCQPTYPPFVEMVDQLKNEHHAPFYHGVASGDPLQDAVILWTRVTPLTRMPNIEVNWEISSDKSFSSVLKSGIEKTDSTRDFTIKVDVNELNHSTKYFYRFRAFGKYSPTGITKTASKTADALRFAVVSCSNYEWGYFNSYRAIANQEDLDVVLHLGDYIYEYGPGRYGDTTLNRINLPGHEIVSLSDYRTRYSQYRLDEDLKAAHAKVPFINIWDDHEIANDSYQSGAQNHQEDEGSYEDRKNAAVKAFYEWMPIRETPTLYRKFDFGNLAEIFMMDERLEGRTAPADSLEDPFLEDESRSMLGSNQLDWLLSGLSNSPAQWKIIGNQVIFSYLNWGFEPNWTINLDSWDGYPAEREKIANHIRENSIENIAFVTGDTHSGWAFEVSIDPKEDYDSDTGEGAFAVEFGTTSINSANSNESNSDEEIKAHEQRIVNSPVNPHLKYANLRDHGFLVLTLTQEQAKAEWHIVSTVRDESFSSSIDQTITVNSGETKLNSVNE